MIAKIIKAKTYLSSLNTILKLYSFSSINEANQNVQKYRKILISLNCATLRRQLSSMSRISKKESSKYNKMQIIQKLCQLDSSLINQRVAQLQNKKTNQIQTLSQFGLDSSQFFPKKLNLNQQPTQQTTDIESQSQYSSYNRIQYQKILDKSLMSILQEEQRKVLFSQKINFLKINEALINNFVKKSQKKNPIQKSLKNDLNSKTQENQFESLKFQSKHRKSPQSQTIDSIKQSKRPLISRLFKTSERIYIPEQKRKYMFEYQKSVILNQLSQVDYYKQLQKAINQIKHESLQSHVHKGFYFCSISKQLKSMKKKITQQYFWKLINLFYGWNYFKQLATNSYLIQFIFALTFDEQLPVQYTILKISEECNRSPQVFEQYIKSISKEFFLKLLRTSIIYIEKMFKISDSDIVVKKDLLQKNKKNKNVKRNPVQDDDYEKNQETLSESQREAQKYPKSKSFIDLELMKFSFALMVGGFRRIIKEINENKELFLNDTQKQFNTLPKREKNFLNATHQTLMLCFSLYKTLQNLFGSIQINDFNDIRRLSQILTEYHNLRKFLSQNMPSIELFERKFDSQYLEKLELGLTHILTQDHLSSENFVLKTTARKLNFDIIDYLNSILKQDNVEITLENRRQLMLSTLQKLLKVYVENQMLDSIDEDLIYVLVRYLEKEVYLEKKVKGLFEDRINFGESSIERNDHKKFNDAQPMIDAKKIGQESKYPQDKPKFESQVLSSSFFDEPSQVEEVSWFQPEVNLISPPQPALSSPLRFSSLIQHKSKPTTYYIGHIAPLLPKNFLFYLILIIKQKHSKKQLRIEPIQRFNLIQQWYSEPNVVRLQFLVDQILERIKYYKEKEARSE